MSVIKNWKCVGDKNAALEHCWGVIAAKDRDIAALREALAGLLDDAEIGVCASERIRNKIRAALKGNGEGL